MGLDLRVLLSLSALGEFITCVTPAALTGADVLEYISNGDMVRIVTFQMRQKRRVDSNDIKAVTMQRSNTVCTSCNSVFWMQVIGFRSSNAI